MPYFTKSKSRDKRKTGWRSRTGTPMERFDLQKKTHIALSQYDGKENMSVFSQRIKEFMFLMNVTLEQLSEKCGVSVKRLNRILEGAMPTISEIKAIANTYDVTIDYFAGMTKYPLMVARSEIQSKINAMVEHLPEEECLGFVENLEKVLKKEGLLDENE